MVMAAGMTGCIKEDMGGCGRMMTFVVHAYDANGNEVTAPVEDVVLYFFNDKMRFTKEVETTVGSRVTVSVPTVGETHVVGWGNLGGGRETRHTFMEGDHRETGYLTLLPVTKAAPVYGSPDDLFYGTLTVAPTASTQGEHEVAIHPKVGGMAVTVRGLKPYAGFNDADYHIQVRETCNSLDFYGICCGDKASYLPAGTFQTVSSREEYKVPAFNLLPEPVGVNIDIYHGTKLVYTASVYNGNTPIQVLEGRLTDVVIDFTAGIRITVSILPWDANPGGKEF